MNEFENKIREIFFYVGYYGVQRKKLDIFKPKSITEEDKIEFKIHVHKGFRIGQSLIIEEIIKLYKQNKVIKDKRVAVRMSKDKKALNSIINEQNEVDFKIKVLRHFSDFIAWQVLGGQYYKARRFYSGQRQRPDLLNTNLESVIMTANKLHLADEKDFALITDLTSFIDIGDVLLIKYGSIHVIECKSGEKQIVANEFLYNIMGDNWKEVVEDLVKTEGSKALKIIEQAERTLAQNNKASRLVDFLNTDFGKDAFSDFEIEIFESKIPEQKYYSELINSFEESKFDKSNYGIIEDIIYYGIYRSPKTQVAQEIFDGMVETLNLKTVSCNYLYILQLPIKEPLFFKPFGEEVFIDLLMERVKLFLAIDLDKLIYLFNQRGFEARWMTRKETNKYLDSKPMYEPFKYKHQSIQVKINDAELVLGSQFLTKLLLDNITPSSFVDQYRSYFEKPIQNIKN